MRPGPFARHPDDFRPYPRPQTMDSRNLEVILARVLVGLMVFLLVLNIAAN